MKKNLWLCLVIVFTLLLLIPLNSYATARWSYIDQIVIDLYFDEEFPSQAHCVSIVSTHGGAYLKTTMELMTQGPEDSEWSKVLSWSNKDVHKTIIDKTATCKAGNFYLLKITTNVYDDNDKIIDTDVSKSNPKKCH